MTRMTPISSGGLNKNRQASRRAYRAERHSVILMALILLAITSSSGCTAVLSPISGVPVRRVPQDFLAHPRADWQQINLARLRQDPPSSYQLDAGDMLGIFIEGVLGDAETPPPVNFPEKGSELPPSIGFPMPVRRDGTVSLPLVPPINVRGLTVEQAENVIRRNYIDDHQILKAEQARIVVTLLRERRYHIIVIREDIQPQGGGMSTNQGHTQGRTGTTGPSQAGRGELIELRAHQNDVLHALAATGGLPGLNAKDEVKILRGRLADAEKRDAFVRDFYAFHQDPCMCPPPLPDDPSTVRIPLRLPPGETPQFKPEDVLLEDGDIVYIESRETEFFYTGGLLPGGQFALPRDYDLDVLGAMAIAGRGVGGNMSGGGGGLAGGISGLGGAPPTQVYIVRQTPCHGQITISVDANRAIDDPRERILIKPGDTVILRYKCKEELANFGIATFFTFGIAELFRR